MEHSLEGGVDGLVLRMRGKFTHRDYSDFLAVTEQVAAKRPQRFILDMDGVDFIDSGGIGMLLMGLDVAQRHGVEMILRGARAQARSIIENAHLAELFTVE